MKAQAEVSVYPLRIKELSGPVVAFCEALRSRGLGVRMRSMSTFISGESKDVFEGLREAFELVAQNNDIVVEVKISNACPEGSGREFTTERVD